MKKLLGICSQAVEKQIDNPSANLTPKTL